MEVALSEQSCPTRGCNALVILPTTIMSRLRESHDDFYCYRGHVMVFNKPKPAPPPPPPPKLRWICPKCNRQGSGSRTNDPALLLKSHLKRCKNQEK